MYTIVVCLIILVSAALLSAYQNIEPYKNPEDPMNYPQKQSDFSCYSYVKNIKKWNPDSYTNEQKKALYTMRAGIGADPGGYENKFPYTNSCVIPTSHLDIYGIDNEKCAMGPHQLTPTISTMNPSGCMLKLDESYDEKSFKKFLTDAYDIYDKENADTIHSLEAQKERLTKLKDKLKAILKNKHSELQQWKQKDDELMKEGSECSEDTKAFKQLFKNYEALYEHFLKVAQGINTIKHYDWKIDIYQKTCDAVNNTFQNYV